MDLISFERFAPMLAKNELKLFDISVLSFMFSPLIIKNVGKSFLSLHLFRISFIVDNVCLIFDLFFVKFIGIACLMSFFKILLYDFKLTLTLSWSSLPEFSVINLRNNLSRNLLEFKIPFVIRRDNLCLCFLILTVFGARYLAFAFKIISSNCR